MTPSLPVAVELGADPDVRVVVTGGHVRSGELSLTGGMAEGSFATLNCDLAFIGIAGICASPGLTEYNPDDARVKRAAIAAARRVIVLADASKLGRVAFSTVAPLSVVDVLVTDAPADHHAAQEIAAAGISIVEAKSATTLARLLPQIADIRRSGSAALDLAAAASGALDAFYGDDLEEWDWVAGALLATEAGAAVGPLPGHGGRSGLLATSPDLRHDLLALLG